MCWNLWQMCWNLWLCVHTLFSCSFLNFENYAAYVHIPLFGLSEDLFLLELGMGRGEGVTSEESKFVCVFDAGLKPQSSDSNLAFNMHLQQTSTDKLRVIVEGLLDTLLTLTVPSPALPQPPHPLYLAMPPPTAEALFRNLCLLGSRRVQVSCSGF